MIVSHEFGSRAVPVEKMRGSTNCRPHDGLGTGAPSGTGESALVSISAADDREYRVNPVTPMPAPSGTSKRANMSGAWLGKPPAAKMRSSTSIAWYEASTSEPMGNEHGLQTVSSVAERTGVPSGWKR